jgi:hypothetical protein
MAGEAGSSSSSTASASSAGAKSVEEYVAKRRQPYIPHASPMLSLRPSLRAMTIPGVGAITANLMRCFAGHALLVSVRNHSNNFFFRDGEIEAHTSRQGSVAHALLISTLRPSLSHDRGFASSVTSSDDGSDKSDLNTLDAVPEELKLRFIESERTYDKAFGFERFWSGAARGLTLVGLSPVHGRGLFALNDIPRGTLVISPRKTAFLDAASFTYVIGGDMVAQAKYGHYSHHSGAFFAPPMNAGPTHLINHSCDANLRAGFFFDPERPASDYAIEGDETQIDRDENPVARYREDPNDVFNAKRLSFDPHALVAARDIRRGEELNFDYAARVAPRYAGELGGILGGASATTYACRCGAAKCRGSLQKGAEAWRMYGSHERRRKAVCDILSEQVPEEDEFHDDPFTRASLLLNRQEIIDLMYGPLCHPFVSRVKRLHVQLAIDNSIKFLNAVDAERDMRP